MIQIPLTLRLATNPLPAAAWVIPGSNVHDWLFELAQCGTSLQSIRLYILPASRASREPAGLLIVPASGQPCTPTARAIPYACIGNRLLIPAQSRLYPAIADDELAKLLMWDLQLLHPAIGLIGFALEDALDAADLLQVPAQTPAIWNLAVSGVAPGLQLQEVIAEALPSVEMMIQEGGGDIASEAMEDLPKQPQESGMGPIVAGAALAPLMLLAGLAAIGERLQQLIHRVIRATGLPSQPPRRGPNVKPKQSLLDRVGQWLQRRGTAGASGPVPPALEEWLRKMYSALAASLEPERNRALQRLMDMLTQDPDEGLRHAISLGGMEGSRGLAPPSSQLTKHNTIFDRSWLSRRGPANPWDISNEMRINLQKRYRELANRELNLGRHRRAAYIFAHLLGDFFSAASALKQGRHFRDAALLYREKLKQPLAAADCLAEGGLLIEAARLYEELQLFEKAGDLYTRLERPDDAADMYRRRVSQLLAKDAIPDAAKLLEGKLHVPDEALALLDSTWPMGSAAKICLRDAFALRSRLGRHEDSLRRIAQLRLDPGADPVILPLAEVLSRIATAYPDQTVRQRAADTTRILVGERLSYAAGSEIESLVRAVVELQPRDRLLSRDGNRFVTQRRPRPALLPPRPTLLKARNIAPKLLLRFNLASDVAWSNAVAAGDCFFAAGRRQNDIVATRASWSSEMVERQYPGGGPTEFPVLLAAPFGGVRAFAVDPARHEGMLMWQTPVVHGTFETCLPKGIFGLAANDEAGLFVVHRMPTGAWVLTVCDSFTEEVLSTHELEFPQSNAIPVLPIAIVAQRKHVFIASGHYCLTSSYGKWKTRVTPRRVTSLVASDAQTRLRIAIVYDEGGLLIWPGEHEQPFAEGLVDPIVAFTRRGTLVALNKTEGRLYRTTDKTVEHFATFPWSSEILAALPTSRLDELAVVSRNGKVQILEVPHE